MQENDGMTLLTWLIREVQSIFNALHESLIIILSEQCICTYNSLGISCHDLSLRIGICASLPLILKILHLLQSHHQTIDMYTT